MKIFNIFKRKKWKDVCVRECASGTWYLLQHTRSSNNKVSIRNVCLDSVPIYREVSGKILVHGEQNITNIIKQNEV